MEQLQEALIQEIRHFTAESSWNRLTRIDGSRMYEEPLVGFADGDDPLFEQYHQIIGEFHLTPRQALNAADEPFVSVISWVLPIAKETLLSNRSMKEGCSVRWNHTRYLGDKFNNILRQHIVDFLTSRGFKATAPVITDKFYQVDLRNGPASTWSERHIAYAAGLGTFSLTDALITEHGIAHRVGSVVCNIHFEPTQRLYSTHLEYCLFYQNGSCGECIKRCPAGALSGAGHDKLKCEQYVMRTLKPWLMKPHYLGDKYIGCGLCLTGTPCEHQKPTKI